MTPSEAPEQAGSPSTGVRRTPDGDSRPHGADRPPRTLLAPVAVAANEAPGVDTAIHSVLGILCEGDAWDAGHAYRWSDDRDRLVPLNTWWPASGTVTPELRRATRERVVVAGGGLVGSVQETGQTGWVEDIGSADGYLRREAVLAAGFRSTVASPVLSGARVVAVFELFASAPRPLDATTVSLLDDVGSVVGRVFEREAAQRQLRRKESRIRGLARRMIEIQEEERTRLSRELHDHVGQRLTALKILLQQTEKGTAAPGALAGGIDVVDELLEDVRSLSLELRPSMLDQVGLAAAIRSYAVRRTSDAGLELELQVDERAPTLPKEARTACFRILQEAVTNVLRHADASRLRVRLEGSRDSVVLVVEDDGRGLSPEVEELPEKTTLGLRIMEERATSVGGEVVFAPGARGGTVVTVTFPAGGAEAAERTRPHRGGVAGGGPPAEPGGSPSAGPR